MSVQIIKLQLSLSPVSLFVAVYKTYNQRLLLFSANFMIHLQTRVRSVYYCEKAAKVVAGEYVLK